jgi:hypothetical protein
MIISRDEFFKWEASTKDTLDVKKIYIDIAQDLVAGILLSQIIYWNSPSKDNKKDSKATITTPDGKRWIAKKRSDWWDECRLTKNQVDRALKVLSSRGIVVYINRRYGGIRQQHIYLDFPTFYKLWQEQLAETDGTGYRSYLKRPDVSDNNVQRSRSSLLRNSGFQCSLIRNSEVPYQGTSYNIDYNIDYEKEEEGEATGKSSEALAEGENEKTVLIESTSEHNTAHTGFFSELAILCQNLFGNDYSLIVPFLEQMKVKSKTQTTFLARTLSERYPREVVLEVVNRIGEQLHTGKLAEYTPTYVLNAMGYLMEDDMEHPKSIHGRFKQFCIDTFGEGEFAQEVYLFYTRVLSTRVKSVAGQKQMSQRRIDNVKAMTTKYGMDHFKRAIRIFTEKKENGTLKDDTLDYFSAYIKKMASSRKEAEPLFKDIPKQPEKPQSERVVPTVNVKINDQYKEEWEIYSWDFKCACEKLVTVFNKTCPQCGAALDWNTASRRFRLGVGSNDRGAAV